MRIAVLRGGALGDVILTLPILRALRDCYPNAFITFVAPYPQAELASRGHADRILDLNSADLVNLFNSDADLPPKIADLLQANLVISYLSDPGASVRKWFSRLSASNFVQGPFRLENEQRPAVEQLALPLQKLGVPMTDPVPRLATGAAGNTMNRLVVHPGSGSPVKNWPVEYWAELISNLISRFSEIVLVSGEADTAVIQALRSGLAIGKVRFLQNRPLWDLVAELESAALFIGHDSGVTHLAAATGIPVVALFGPTSPEIWRPNGDQVAVIKSSDHTMTGISPESVHDFLCSLHF